jgi:hypothetical protein
MMMNITVVNIEFEIYKKKPCWYMQNEKKEIENI